MQAITTKFIGPTDLRGARIKARCQAGSKTVGYTYHRRERDHACAVAALLQKLGWGGDWVSGGLPDGRGDAFVCAKAGHDFAGATIDGELASELIGGAP
jgi:hypothetical protein